MRLWPATAHKNKDIADTIRSHRTLEISYQPAEKRTNLKRGATNTNTYTGRAGQAKISFRHSKKIDGNYDNDNRSASAPLTTI